MRSLPPRPVARQRPDLAGGDHLALRRRADAFSLAFVLLGGRRAANSFLDSEHRSLAGVPRTRAGTSALGLVEVVRVLRREALASAAMEIQS